jgi:hypothetical protein
MLKEESINFETGVWLCIARETGIYNAWFLCEIYLTIQKNIIFYAKILKKLIPTKLSLRNEN